MLFVFLGRGVVPNAIFGPQTDIGQDPLFLSIKHLSCHIHPMGESFSSAKIVTIILSISKLNLV